MSRPIRAGMQESLIHGMRHFIAGAILFNQRIADQVGLHLTDMQCLNVLDLLGPVTPGKLAACTGLSTGGVTVMLDRLEKAGFIRRGPNPLDRRSLLIHIHAGKMRKVRPYYAKIDVRLKAFLDSMPLSDLESAVAFFSQMNAMHSTDLQKESRRPPRTMDKVGRKVADRSSGRRQGGVGTI